MVRRVLLLGLVVGLLAVPVPRVVGADNDRAIGVGVAVGVLGLPVLAMAFKHFVWNRFCRPRLGPPPAVPLVPVPPPVPLFVVPGPQARWEPLVEHRVVE